MRIDELRQLLLDSPDSRRVDLRWWLAEGTHTDQTLRAEIAAAHRLGFGGMEFLAMDERTDHARFGWGSREWARSTRTVLAETARLGMNVSLTSGANWSNANLPTITPDDDAASQELDVVTEELGPSQTRSGAIPRVDLTALGGRMMLPGEMAEVTRQRLVAVLAARVVSPAATAESLDRVSRHLRLPAPDVLAVDSVIDLTECVRDDELEWTAPEDGTWLLMAFHQHGTGQIAEPSATRNVTVNYLEADGVRAVIDYWTREVLTDEVLALIAANPKPQLYMDSLELAINGDGGMFWGRTVAEEFRARRGYDITPYLPFLACAMPMMASSLAYRHEPEEGDAERIAKVRRDYFQTLTDLYIENMLRPMAQWLHSVGIGLRAEISYGQPFEITQPGGEVDGIETESLGFGSQIDGYRLLAGPAHLLGTEYSSETGATTRNHVLPHRFYDQIMSTQFAAGVTRTVLHGWASVAGPEGATSWPGHEGMYPMFSERFDLRQPASELYPLWTRAMQRTQALLALGRPRVDLVICRRDHLVDNGSGTAFIAEDGSRILDEDFYGHRGMRDRTNLWWQDLSLQDAGWTYDFLDPALLLRDDVEIMGGEIQPDGPGYRAVILYQEELDVDAAKLLLRAARQGLRSVIVHGAREVVHLLRGLHRTHAQAAIRTPGLDGRDEELREVIEQLRAEPTVAEVDRPSEALAALRDLGVEPRAPFAAENRSVLVRTGEDGDVLTAFVYHVLYEDEEATEVEVALEGEGVPRRLDPWTGRLAEHLGHRIEGGRTVVALALRPGESALIELDRAAAPSPRSEPAAEREIAAIDAFDLVVESWDAGEEEVIEEDHGEDGICREVRPSTATTLLRAGMVAPAPWKDLPAIGPDVAGIGTYTATFTLPVAPASGERVILDLGSTAGGLASVRIGDGAEIGVDTSACRADITEHVAPGENPVTIRVASQLANRLLARGYYEHVPDLIGAINGTGPTMHVDVQDCGLLGPVRVLVREDRSATARPGRSDDVDAHPTA